MKDKTFPEDTGVELVCCTNRQEIKRKKRDKILISNAMPKSKGGVNSELLLYIYRLNKYTFKK